MSNETVRWACPISGCPGAGILRLAGVRNRTPRFRVRLALRSHLKTVHPNLPEKIAWRLMDMALDALDSHPDGPK
jgi:hypothetical protein